MNGRRNKQSDGFTVAELITVVAIVGHPCLRGHAAGELRHPAAEGDRAARAPAPDHRAIDRYHELRMQQAGAERHQEAADSQPGDWPKDLEELTKPIELNNGKSVRLLRERDLIDPMTGKKEWITLADNDEPDSPDRQDRQRFRGPLEVDRARSTARRTTTNGERLKANANAKRTQSGFTLIELIVVVTIIGILAGVAISNVKWAQKKAREAALRHDLFEMRKAIDDYYADKQKYPDSLDALKSEHYLRNIPKDPITRSRTGKKCRTSPIRTDPNQRADRSDRARRHGGPPGISDVKSKAPGDGLDGNAVQGAGESERGQELRRDRPSTARPPYSRAPREPGFTLAALIVILTIMMIFVAYTVPRQWSTVMQREREQQTIYAMRQYARASTNSRRSNNTYPTSPQQLKEATPAALTARRARASSRSADRRDGLAAHPARPRHAAAARQPAIRPALPMPAASAATGHRLPIGHIPAAPPQAPRPPRPPDQGLRRRPVHRRPPAEAPARASSPQRRRSVRDSGFTRRSTRRRRSTLRIAAAVTIYP